MNPLQGVPDAELTDGVWDAAQIRAVDALVARRRILCPRSSGVPAARLRR